MAEQAIFKSQTFGGFNKEEVLKYIDNLNSQHSEEQDKNNEIIVSLNNDLSEKSTALDELHNNYDEIMVAYEELRQHYLMLKEHSDNISAENEKLAERLEKAEKELAIEKELNSQLEDKLENERKKAEEYTKNVQKLRFAIDEAEASTKVMIANAKDGAQYIIENAQSSADSINTEIDSFKEEIEKTKSFMEDSLTVLIQRLGYIEKTAENAKISSEARTSTALEVDKKYNELVEETKGKSEALKKRFFR